VDLKWWPVALVGSTCLVAVVALAALLSMTAARRQLRPLANVQRLTRLPEYAKAARLRSLSTIATLGVLTIMFGGAIWAGARPTMASADFDATHPEDVMLCVGQPVTDAATAELLDYFARRATTFPQAQRIGLTSANRRLVPLTRDHDYAATQFGDYADGRAVSATFAPLVPYTDYAPSVDDVLALCLSGFAGIERQDTHRRSLIYLGPAELRSGDERRAALFTDRSLGDLAKRIGAQINVVDTARSPASGVLAGLADQTAGQYVAPAADSLTLALNQIRAHAPPARRADGTLVTTEHQDSPVLPLVLALLAAAVLSVTLLVLRR
jgi:hypothetical protein